MFTLDDLTNRLALPIWLLVARAARAGGVARCSGGCCRTGRPRLRRGQDRSGWSLVTYFAWLLASLGWRPLAAARCCSALLAAAGGSLALCGRLRMRFAADLRHGLAAAAGRRGGVPGRLRADAW